MLTQLRGWRNRRTCDQHGASAVEYGLLIVGIASLIVVIVYAFGPILGDIFGDTCDDIATRRGDPSCIRE